MNILMEKATAAASSLKTEDDSTQAGIDPATLQTILKILTAIVSAMIGCKIPAANAAAIAAKPGPFHRMHVRRIVLQNTDETFCAECGPELVKTILSIGPTITQDEMTEMYGEVSEVQV